MSDKPFLHVVCAVIVQEGKILITQRSATMKQPLKWEFPGGKLEPYEKLEDAVVREIREELTITIEVIKEYPFYAHHYPDFSLKMYPFEARIISGEITLKEHAAYKWVKAEELDSYDFSNADIPLLIMLKSLAS